MSISITASAVNITTQDYSLDDIYQYAVSNNLTAYIKKLGSSYEIKGDLIIKSGGSITDSNISLTILGDLIQIHKGCSLTLGEKRADNTTLNGCILSAPNIKLVYGFGCVTYTDSGDLFLYGSIVNVFGFWGFFEGNNHVEIIDCQVDGFGRISGKDSILKNINFKKSHGQYGILSPKGELKIMENLSVGDSFDTGSFKCSVYHNPKYANDLTILGGRYAGYSKLAYIESEYGGDKLIFINSEIVDGYELYREASNVDFYHKFTFSPIIKTSDAVADGVKVVIKDSTNKVVFDSLTDPNGRIKEDITYYFQDRNGAASYKTPHTVTLSKDNITIDYEIKIDHKMVDFPLYLIDVSPTVSGNSDCSISDIQTINNDFENRLTTKLNLMESGIRQILGNVIDEVNQNETYFKETGFSIMM